MESNVRPVAEIVLKNKYLFRHAGQQKNTQKIKKVKYRNVNVE